MKPQAILISATLAIALSLPAQAQGIITGANTDEILNIARGHGPAILGTQSNGDPQIKGTINGTEYHIYFRNCTNNTDCEDLNFYLGLLDIDPSPALINDWNLNKRFSRAYLDQDNDPCVEMDLDLVNGVSADYLDAQFAIWDMVVTQFPQYMGYK